MHETFFLWFSRFSIISRAFGNPVVGSWFCLFVWFVSLRPVNYLSAIKRRVFLGWTSSKLGLMFLLKDTTQWRKRGSNPRPLGHESRTLPQGHCAPMILEPTWRLLVMVHRIWPVFSWHFHVEWPHLDTNMSVHWLRDQQLGPGPLGTYWCQTPGRTEDHLEASVLLVKSEINCWGKRFNP